MACGQRAALGFADVLRDHVASLNLSPEQGKVAAHILACRTGRLGGHAFVCDRCGGKHYAFNSCRDRHCPRCGGLDQAIWAEAQQQHLLPLSYFHLVFTIPASLRPFFLGKGRVHALEALFAAASETILDVGARRGLRLGVLAVLHTWNQLLHTHPHIHCLVPGGAFSKDGFVVMKRFLFSYKLLREVFKIKLLQKLRALLKEDVLILGGSSAYQLLGDADSREWNMKVKRAMAGPDAVIKYFARYTKRIALSESRIVAYNGETVTFRYRNRQDGNRVKTATLDAPTFCLRFFNHVLPAGFVRIRRTGFWSNRSRKQSLEEARTCLNADPPPGLAPETRSATCLRIFGKDPSPVESALMVGLSWSRDGPRPRSPSKSSSIICSRGRPERPSLDADWSGRFCRRSHTGGVCRPRGNRGIERPHRQTDADRALTWWLCAEQTATRRISRCKGRLCGLAIPQPPRSNAPYPRAPRLSPTWSFRSRPTLWA